MDIVQIFENIFGGAAMLAFIAFWIFIFIWAVLSFLLPIFVYILKRRADTICMMLAQIGMTLEAQRTSAAIAPKKPLPPIH